MLSALAQAPSRYRYGVLAFVCALSMITYLDRVCFGSAQSSIIADLGLTSEADMKWAFTAFAFAYAAFEVPSGWLGDVFGPRRTLIRIVLWWSLFTAITGIVGLKVAGYEILGGLRIGGYQILTVVGIMVGVRFLFGMGEAGAYPNITRALHNWFPFTQRGMGQGAVWMSGRLMGGLTPLVWLALVEYGGFSWRHAFWTFGVLGIGWCIAFSSWFRNQPHEKASVNEAELQLIRAGRSDTEAAHSKVPWKRLLASRNLWALCLMYFCAAYGWYFNITYLHRFLEQQHGIDPKSVIGAIYKGGPLWLGAIACLTGGVLTDLFIKRSGNRKWGRRIFGMVGHSLCALFYFACLFTKGSAFLFFLAISLAAFCNDLTMGAAWAVCQDIGKRYAAIVAGCMNTIGNLGGAVAGYVTGTILERYLDNFAAAKGVEPDQLSGAEKATALLPGFEVNFLVFGLVYVVAVFLWLQIDPTKPIEPDTESPAAGMAH
jgi:ACS family glucarate transporter-like MFS transporter